MKRPKPAPPAQPARDWDHNCIGNGCRFAGCENQRQPPRPRPDAPPPVTPPRRPI